MTAHHVIKGHDPATLAISFVTTRGLRAVTMIHLHETADVAILETEDPETGSIEPLSTVLDGIHLGETFMAIGFPSELMFGQAGGSPHRMLWGHYQRFMNYESVNGYQYLAGEMSVPNPKGMSGAPLVRPESPRLLSGLATETVEVESYPTLVHEETIDGHTNRVMEKRLIQYGVAVILGNLIDWINERVPPAPGTQPSFKVTY